MAKSSFWKLPKGVEIETKPTWPGHVARITELVAKAFTTHRVPSRDRRLHGADWRPTAPHGVRDQAEGRVQQGRHGRGTVSMARAGHPDSADSQFFICFGDASSLTAIYVWASDLSMENVDKIKRRAGKGPDQIITAKIKDAT